MTPHAGVQRGRGVRVLGIDPGSRVTGWGVVESCGERMEHVGSGTIALEPAVPLGIRLARLYAEQLRQDGTGYVSLYAALCPVGKCQVTDEQGLPLAFDYGHLTTSGSTVVAQRIKRWGAL